MIGSNFSISSLRLANSCADSFSSSSFSEMACSASDSLSIAFCCASGEFSPAAKSAPASAIAAIASVNAAAASGNSCSLADDVASAVFPSSSA